MGFFNDVMTVYNYYKDPATGQEEWNRSVIKGVQWTHGKRQIKVVNGTATESITESITIDFERNYVGNKPYINPIDYAKLPAEEAESYWTLNDQDGIDILVCGESDKEISREYKVTSLAKDFQYTGTVSQVADNRNRPRLKTIKVVAI